MGAEEDADDRFFSSNISFLCGNFVKLPVVEYDTCSLLLVRSIP